MAAYSEQELIAGCRNNNRAVQEHVYKTYYSRFMKVCARYARDMHDAEQLLNDGFLRIFSKVDDFKNKGSFEGWMNRIMVNICLDYLKSSYMKSSMKMQINNAIIDKTDIPINSEAIEKIEFRELVVLIQTLPVMTRTVFNLYVFEEYTHKQISLMLEISEGTSQWHLHQARKQLKSKIKKNDSQNLLYEGKRI
jgi:RNA polymerase sigma factor (sigma-70 family)